MIYIKSSLEPKSRSQLTGFDGTKHHKFASVRGACNVRMSLTTLANRETFDVDVSV
jgi:hypothetical protein